MFKMKGPSLYSSPNKMKWSDGTGSSNASPMKKFASAAQRKAVWASKNEKSPMKAKDCNCWEGHSRVPGTKPCAKGSCKKD